MLAHLLLSPTIAVGEDGALHSL
jgi:hypothetical protein